MKRRTFLSGIKTKRPTKQTTKRNAVIQPNPGSFTLYEEFPSVFIPDNSYVFLFIPNKYEAKPPAFSNKKLAFFLLMLGYNKIIRNIIYHNLDFTSNCDTITSDGTGLDHGVLLTSEGFSYKTSFLQGFSPRSDKHERKKSRRDIEIRD